MAKGKIENGTVGSYFDDFLKEQGIYSDCENEGLSKVKEYKSEANIQAMIMMELSAIGCLIFRNNVGSWKDKSGRWIKYGVGNRGGSDLIGVTPDGKFLAVECKTATGAIRPGQREFIWAVRKAGGYGGIARSVEDALAIARGEEIGC